MSRYYIHKVGHQEMGSVIKSGDKPARGRYFLISKSCLEFFPHISSVVMNDKVVLTVIPMREGKNPEKVLCTMDYHNQKYADIEYTGKNPRNEIRLYMNNEIDPDKQYFAKDDYAIFERFENNGDVCYSLTRITQDHNNYQDISDIIDKHDKRFHANAIIDSFFDFIDQPNIEGIVDVIVTEEAEKVIKTESETLLKECEKTQTSVDEDEFVIEESMGCSIFNSSLFHDLVMHAYNYKCAITGKVIRYKDSKIDLYNLEAAHIKPQAHQGTFLPCNGIAMSRDMHFAFDKGFFTIDDEYNIIVSEKLKDSWFYKDFNGKKMFVPSIPFYRPQPIFLKHHRDNVFETFRQIRRNSYMNQKRYVQEEKVYYKNAAEKESEYELNKPVV